MKSLSSKLGEWLLWGEKGEYVVRIGPTRVLLNCYHILLLDWGNGYISVVLYALSICILIIKSYLFFHRHVLLRPDYVLKYCSQKTNKKTGLTSWRNGWFQNWGKKCHLDHLNIRQKESYQRLLGSQQKDSGTKLKRLTQAKKEKFWTSITLIEHVKYV